MRVVLDTNVLLSGLFTRGVCEALLDLCMPADNCTVILSEHILKEFSRHAASKFGAAPEEIEAATSFLRRHAEIVEPAPVPKNACPDADDLPILGAVVAGRADILVTGDAALLAIRKFQGVPILSPRAFFDRVQ